MRTITLQKNGILQEIAIALAGSLFLSLMAQVSIPFFYVPFTLQTLGVFLIGGILGPSRGIGALVAYLIEGSCGLPVFAGGAVRPLWFMGLHAGYLSAFPVAAYLVGRGTQQHKSFVRFLLALLVGEVVILGMGTAWLSVFLGWKKAYLVGAYPFFPGAAIKILSGALILKNYVTIRRALVEDYP